MEITPESEDKDDTGKQNDHRGLLHPLKLFDPLKSSTQRKVGISDSSSASRSECSKVYAEPCVTSFLGKRTPREQGSQILSPVQRMFKQKREKLSKRKPNLRAKKSKKQSLSAKLKEHKV